MIKLITQFDDPTKRVAIATPTCCCCCCCCVATIATSSAITFLNLNNIARNKIQETEKKYSFTYAFAGLILLPLLLGIVLYLANFFSKLFDSVIMWLLFLIGLPIIWASLLKFLYNKVGAKKATKYAIMTVILTILGAILELFAATNLIFRSNSESYILSACIFTFIAIVYKLHIDKRI